MTEGICTVEVAQRKHQEREDTIGYSVWMKRSRSSIDEEITGSVDVRRNRTRLVEKQQDAATEGETPAGCGN